jgi:hypothetical protein
VKPSDERGRARRKGLWIDAGRRNSGEPLAIYAASRINQLRKSSSAASQLNKVIKINDLRDYEQVGLVST